MSTETVIFTMTNVTKRYEKNVVLEDVSLSYFYGAKIGVLGLNGAGKSTLLRIIAGVDTDYDGRIDIRPEYKVGYLPQEPPLPDDKTVREVVEGGMQPVLDLLAEFEAINEKFAEEMSADDMEKLLERQGQVQEKLDLADAWELESKLAMAMQALDCPDPDALIGPLSGGEKRRVALCRLLLEQPDVLLLDEPTNHLDAASVAWLERHLSDYPGTVIAITHDRYFLDNVAGWMLEIEHGKCLPWKGNYSSWLHQKQKRLALEDKQSGKRAKELKRELEWIGTSPSGRQAKNKARITRFEQLRAEDARKRAKEVQIYLAPGRRLGDQVIELRNVSKSFGDKVLLDGVSFELPPGGIIGVVGPNGAGKTTLFKLITGTEEPDSGEVVVGETVELAYVEQMREGLRDTDSVWQSISDGDEILKIGDIEVNSRAYVARFNFSGGDQQQSVGTLSGGQRNRVNLARMLTQSFNVLLLDEPTNDLDVNTIRSLEEALETFPGCAIVVSHDRWFLDRVATHILAFEGEGQVRFFQGNYAAYAAFREEHAEAEPAGRHAKLTR